MTAETLPPRVLAARHAARRRHRLTRIRKTVAAVSLAVFIALFSGIYVQMALGRDPVLGHKAVAATTTTKTTSKASGAAASGSSGSSSASGWDDTSSYGTSSPSTAQSSSGTTGAQPSAVTTSQS